MSNMAETNTIENVGAPKIPGGEEQRNEVVETLTSGKDPVGYGVVDPVVNHVCVLKPVKEEPQASTSGVGGNFSAGYRVSDLGQSMAQKIVLAKQAGEPIA